MIKKSIETRVYFDSNVWGYKKRVDLAKHLCDCDKEQAWKIQLTTVGTKPSIVLNCPVTEAEAVAKALASWKETKDD